MTIFKDILAIWKSDNLLSQAWEDSLRMLSLSNDIFVQSIQYFNSGENIDAVKALKKKINQLMTIINLYAGKY